MSYIFIIAGIFSYFSVPHPVLNWDMKESITITAEGEEDLLDRCLEGGVEVRYRFEMRYCTQGNYWFDDCDSKVVIIKSLQFSPLKETYTLESDRLGDEGKPELTTFNEKLPALKALRTVPNLKLSVLAKSRPVFSSPDDYVEVRIVSDCKGSVGGPLLDISHFVSFGLIKINRFDSGWLSFFLKNGKH